VCSCTDASTTKLLGIWPTTARQYLTLFSASVCVRPAVIKSPFHTTGSARTAVGLFPLLVWRSGTHCPKTCGIRSVLWTVTDSHWRHFYFRISTSVFSSLEVCYDNALYKFTFDIDIWYWPMVYWLEGWSETLWFDSSGKGCLQLLEILEISWNLIDAPWKLLMLFAVRHLLSWLYGWWALVGAHVTCSFTNISKFI